MTGFRTQNLILNNQVISATGNDLFLNGYNITTLTGFISGGNSLQTGQWKYVNSSGYAQVFNPISGYSLITKINGYSKSPNNINFIQIFDGLVQTGSPIASFAVQSGTNFFYDFSENGVEFKRGVTIANSLDLYSIQSGVSDFFVTLYYKQ